MTRLQSYLLNEKVYGKQVIGFHRTNKNSFEKIFKGGYKIGSGALYGPGIYITYDLEDQLNDRMKNLYGSIIIKSKAKMKNILVLERDEAKKIYGNNYDLLSQYNTFQNKIEDTEFEKFISNYNFDKKYSSDYALRLWQNVMNSIKIKKCLKGLMFNGRSDGKVLVVYDTNLIIPISYSNDDGETWYKTVINRELIKKSIKDIEFNDPTPSDYGILEWKKNDDGSYDIYGDVYMVTKKFKKMFFKLNVAHNNFYCDENYLKSLENMPKYVKGTFSVCFCRLKSLKNGPIRVDKNYQCSWNNLTNLKGSPDYVGDNFNCDNNKKLISLEGSPKEVKGDFNCSGCQELKSLKGITQNIGGSIYCRNTNISDEDIKIYTPKGVKVFK